jgi:DNA topoisomerase II
MDSSKYKCLTQLEHVLQRPDMYIGATAVAPIESLVFYQEGTKTVSRVEEAVYSPALVHLFSEVLVNAIDNQERCASQRTIRIDTKKDGTFKIWNDGDTIPITKQEDGRYIPTVIFSEFLSGSNFDDVDRTTGGCNGVGIKAVNAWSKRFQLVILNAECKRRFEQSFSNNMSEMSNADVKYTAAKKSSLSVEWTPDYERLGMDVSDGLPDDVMRVIESKAIEACVCTRPDVTVYLNGKKLGIKTPAALMSALYSKGSVCKDSVAAPNGCSLQVAVAECESNQSGRTVAFVNGVSCPNGTHIDMVVRRVFETVMNKVKKKNADAVRPSRARDAMNLVIVLRTHSPRFTSQKKDTLDTPVRQFGFTWDPSETFRSAVSKSGIVQRVNDLLGEKEEKNLCKLQGSIRRANLSLIKGFDPARLAGKGSDCWLIVTEGESAKTLAVAGVSSIGRDRFGIYPLRGKLLNVKRVGDKKCAANRELADMCSIIGLERSKEYTPESVRRLRYTRLAIFADQDHDGSHIAGLVLNWIATHYPSVLQSSDFLYRIVTPIIRATNPVTKDRTPFFSYVEFDDWRKSLVKPVTDFKVYKGLGTSTPEEAVEYFAKWDQHVIQIQYSGDTCAGTLNLFFDETLADARKDFILNEYDSRSFVDYSLETTDIDTFLRNEMSHFSVADVKRSIPSVIDGFKPTQRKVMHTFLKKRFTYEQKVFEAAAAVCKDTAYHHGDQSMVDTVIGMAQDHCGTNNIAFFVPKGTFGSRLDAPKVHAKARYINTFLDPVTEHFFRKEDNVVLAFKEDEGRKIEPETFVPVVPTVLINGAFGIATGWMSFVPNYNPEEIIEACLNFARSGEWTHDSLIPWYRHYGGEITLNDGTFCTTGRCEVVRGEGNVVLRVSELPICRWSHDYVEWLKESFISDRYDAANEKGRVRFASDVKDECSVYGIGIDVYVYEEARVHFSDDQLVGMLHLSETKKMHNMYLFDGYGKLRRFSSAEEILQEHAAYRVKVYDQRKTKQLELLREEQMFLEHKKKYLAMLREGRMDVRTPKGDKISYFEEQFFPRMSDSYDYLTELPISSLGDDAFTRLEAKVTDNEKKISNLLSKTACDMWTQELETLLEEYHKYSATKDAVRVRVERTRSSTVTGKKEFRNNTKRRKKVTSSAP